MKPIGSSKTRLAPRPLVVCLAIALGVNAPPSGATQGAGHASAPPSVAHARDPILSHAPALFRRATAAPSGGNFTVTNCDDSGPGSLRDISTSVVDGSVIDLTRLSCSVITLTSGAVNFLVNSVRLYGPGPDRLALVGNGVDRVIGHAGTGTIVVNGLTLRGGAIPNSAGGCLYSSSSIRLYDDVITSCRTYSTGTYTVLGGGVYARGNLSIAYTQITDNLVTAPSGHAYGGGLFVRGDLIMRSSTISDNVASGLVGNTGGIAATGNVYIGYSTISGNEAQFNAGLALFGQYSTDPFEIKATTISGNVASVVAGGVGTNRDIYLYDSTITANRDTGGGPAQTGGLFLGTGVAAHLQSTIVAKNFTGTTPTDINGYSGAYVTGYNNLVIASTLPLPSDTLAVDPLLGPLADNGGPTATHALLPGSPAIGAGNNYCDCIYDQRGTGSARRVGNGVDIGAFEIQSSGGTHTVSNCNDTGTGSLRDAATNAVSGDVIDLSTLGCSTISLTSGEIRINEGNLTLLGPGAGNLTIDGNDSSRILYHVAPGTLTVSGMTLTNGYFVADGYAEGGCIFDRTVLVLDDVKVASCGAVSRNEGAAGGAILSFTLDMSHTTISDSTVGATHQEAIGGGVFAGQLSMRDSTVADNATYGPDSHSYGGGVAVSGHASIMRSTVSGNAASDGGGIFAGYVANVVDSTISGNTAFTFGGGILVTGTLGLYNSTVALNTGSSAYDMAAGVNVGGSARLQSSIVFGNTIGGTPYDAGTYSTAVFMGSHNLIGTAHILMPPDTLHDDPELGPLTNNGGVTATHALAADSPAIDAGNNALALDTDQRGSGFARVVGAAADIGAYELQPGAGDTIFRDGFDGF